MQAGTRPPGSTLLRFRTSLFSLGMSLRAAAGVLSLCLAAAGSAQRHEPGEETRRGLGPVRILIDSDAGNYYDDAFALACAALSSDRIRVEAVYAAPFVNSRVGDPGDGVDRSLVVIRRVMSALDREGTPPVLPGARRWMGENARPVPSEAVDDMVQRVMTSDRGIDYVVALGAATNVASALLQETKLAEKTTVVWLGGTPHHFPSASEFNLKSDPAAARVLFDSGAKLVHIPAAGVAEYLAVSREELEARLRGRSRVADMLLALVDEFAGADAESDNASTTLPVWDLAAIAALLDPSWVPTMRRFSPSLGRTLTWLHSPLRHKVRVAYRVDRDRVFTDFFAKIEAGRR